MTETATEYVQPKFQLHLFSAEISDEQILYQVLKMEDSLMIIINHKYSRCFNDLSMAINSPYDSIPAGTRIIGDFRDETSKAMATRLSDKLGKAVYVSYNVDCDKPIVPLIERQLFQEIKDRPEKF